MLLTILKSIVSGRRAEAAVSAEQTCASLQQAIRLQAEGQLEAAECAYRQVLAANPDHADAAHLLGVLLYRAERPKDALPFLELAVRLRPNHAESALHMGSVYQALERFDDAERAFRRAISIAPELVAVHVSLGILLKQCGRLDQARLEFESALKLQPDLASLWYNMGNLQWLLGDCHGARANLERALEIDPSFLEARFSRALVLLALGDLSVGWVEHEIRHQLPRCAAGIRPFHQPRWRGEPLYGRTLLVWGEQGIGDELLYAGMYHELVTAGANCIFECSSKLVPLFARSFPESTVIARETPAHPVTAERIDFQMPAGDLARYLRPTLDKFPVRAAYLRPDPIRLLDWRTRLAALGPGLKVGFCWRSSDTSGDRALACTRLDQWDALLQNVDVHWVCLQYDECSSELEAAAARHSVKMHRYDIDYFNDLDEVSALTAALDLVISAPTAVSVHAAALGVEVWQLTSGADWQTHGTQCVPWYPSMIQYSRRWDEPWSAVLQRVESALFERASQGIH